MPDPDPSILGPLTYYPVYCKACDEQIDVLTCAEGVSPSMVAAYVCGDSLRMRRATGCVADMGWRIAEKPIEP